MDWFNNRRLLEPIGFIPPAEAEERYFAMLNDKAMAASLKQNRLRQSWSGSVFLFSHQTAAFEAIAATLPSSVGVEAQRAFNGDSTPSVLLGPHGPSVHRQSPEPPNTHCLAIHD